MPIYDAPIIIIEDDAQDAETIGFAIRESGVKNKVVTLNEAEQAIEFLLHTEIKPMVIFCDIKMGKLDGLSLRRRIIEEPKLLEKAIPFVFLSGLTSNSLVKEAYKLNIQGFFRKPSTYQELKDFLINILAYWQRAIHPE